MYATKHVSTYDNGDVETIICVREEDDDQILASFVVEDGELKPLSPREPQERYVRLARSKV